MSCLGEGQGEAVRLAGLGVGDGDAHGVAIVRRAGFGIGQRGLKKVGGIHRFDARGAVAEACGEPARVRGVDRAALNGAQGLVTVLRHMDAAGTSENWHCGRPSTG